MCILLKADRSSWVRVRPFAAAIPADSVSDARRDAEHNVFAYRKRLRQEIEGGRLALGSLRLSQPRMAPPPPPPWAPFFVGMSPFGLSGGSKFRRGSQISGPLFLVWASFLEVKKHQSVNIRKII